MPILALRSGVPVRVPGRACCNTTGGSETTDDHSTVYMYRATGK
uniref:Uncharacterized protein n=1 Tax=Verrucosispora sp. MS100047 TaxID=1410949 RepID=A0A097CSJ3_9ACTN|nr:hypothetical protein VASRM7_382 [Verrucosispora sp. MS100047]